MLSKFIPDHIHFIHSKRVALLCRNISLVGRCICVAYSAFCLGRGVSVSNSLRFQFLFTSSFNPKSASYFFFCIQFLVRLFFFAVAILVAKTSYRLLLPDLKQRLSGHLGRLPVCRYPLCDYKITQPMAVFKMEWFIKLRAFIRTKHRICGKPLIFRWQLWIIFDRIKLLGGQIGRPIFVYNNPRECFRLRIRRTAFWRVSMEISPSFTASKGSDWAGGVVTGTNGALWNLSVQNLGRLRQSGNVRWFLANTTC